MEPRNVEKETGRCRHAGEGRVGSDDGLSQIGAQDWPGDQKLVGFFLAALQPYKSSCPFSA